ncbi:alanine racemase [Solibacillus silvestris]|uniref:alanine racemase n=1 Tax=Solibacillus silvestris TaxID=76853 RepID=UPI003F7D2CCA
MKHLNEVFANVEHPFAWIDLNALQQNIDYVNQACGEKKIRIATKSIRSVPLLQYIAKRLTHFAGYMTFTASETNYLLEQGLDELLIGYPVYERNAILKLAHWVKRGKSITFMVDHIQQAQLLNDIAQRDELQFSICIDLNVSTDFKVLYFGTKRSPISNFHSLNELLQQIDKLQHVTVQGVMGYDAQIAGVTDKTKLYFGAKDALISLLKKQSAKTLIKSRQFLVAHLKAMYNIAFVNAGGSGSMAQTAVQKDVTEVTVGSAFFASALFDQYKSLSLKPAAGFALRVTRQFSENIVVCHGGGYIASGASGPDRSPVFMEKDRFSLVPLEGAGEVQTPVIVKKGKTKIGDTVYFRHAKAGELCERFLVLHAIEDGLYKEQFQTYRGDGQCFL